jgi:hypothetical protein
MMEDNWCGSTTDDTLLMFSKQPPAPSCCPPNENMKFRPKKGPARGEYPDGCGRIQSGPLRVGPHGRVKSASER